MPDDRAISNALEKVGKEFKGLAPKIILLLVRNCRIQRAMAEDIVQKVFLKLVEYIRDGKLSAVELVDDPKHLQNYLVKSCFHEAYNVLKARNEKNITTLIAALDLGPTPEEALQTEENKVKVRKAVDRLEEPYRTIFKLLLEEEISLAEISKRLGWKSSSIYTQFQRGLSRLEKLFRTL